jgi:hypothetical protein
MWITNGMGFLIILRNTSFRLTKCLNTPKPLNSLLISGSLFNSGGVILNLIFLLVWDQLYQAGLA